VYVQDVVLPLTKKYDKIMKLKFEIKKIPISDGYRSDRQNIPILNDENQLWFLWSQKNTDLLLEGHKPFKLKKI
jgi:hypothetical protein